MYLLKFLDTVYVPLRLRGRSAESVRLLRHAIHQFSLFLGRDAQVKDLDDLVVSQFLLARSAKLAPESVARERSGLCALWNVANARGLTQFRPCIPAEIIPRRTPRALTEDELRRLFHSAGQERGAIGPILAKAFFPALIVTAFESSERINALLHIPRDGWQRPSLLVPANVRKGGVQPRHYVLSTEACDFLDAASCHHGPHVLWWPYTTTALYARWKNITERAGLGRGRDVQFHVLRRSAASHLEASGGDAQAQLGHGSRRMTEKYLAPRIVGRAKRAAWEMLPRITLPPVDPPPAA
jgi:integrase